MLYLKLLSLVAAKTNFGVFAFHSEGICGQINKNVYRYRYL